MERKAKQWQDVTLFSEASRQAPNLAQSPVWTVPVRILLQVKAAGYEIC